VHRIERAADGGCGEQGVSPFSRAQRGERGGISQMLRRVGVAGELDLRDRDQDLGSRLEIARLQQRLLLLAP